MNNPKYAIGEWIVFDSRSEIIHAVYFDRDTWMYDLGDGDAVPEDEICSESEWMERGSNDN